MALPLGAGIYAEGKDICAKFVGLQLREPGLGHHFFATHPRAYEVAAPVAIVSFLLTAAVSLPHLRSLVCLRKTALPTSLRMTVAVAAAPMVICFFNVLAVVWPRAWRGLFLGAAFYEAAAFLILMRLICNLVVEEDGDYTDERVVKALDAPSKPWAVPPFACCCRPCVRARHFAKCDLVAVRILVGQFALMAPSVAVADWSDTLGDRQLLGLHRAEMVSLLVAMYALFCLLEATSGRLHTRHSHSKFWTVKGTFIVNTVAFRIASVLVVDDIRVGSTCYRREALASAWSGMATAALSLPLAALSRHAYPAEELECEDA